MSTKPKELLETAKLVNYVFLMPEFTPKVN